MGCQPSHCLGFCVSVLESFVATGQLVEQLLIERFALLPTACRHENVASDKLMNDFAISGHTAEGNVHIPFKLNGHLEEMKMNTKEMQSYLEKVLIQG